MREIFISDIHWPHHDKAAWNVALKAIVGRNPDIVHIGGDGVDFHSISRHPKQMIDRTILVHEVEESRRELERVRKAAPSAKINFQEGNHDARMQVYLRDRAPELSGLVELTFPSLMHLERHGIEWIPEDRKHRIGKLWHHHGHLIGGAGVSPARAKFGKTFQNLIFGHHHKFDYYSANQYGTNEVIQVIGNANLYTIEADYAHHTNWHLGFTEINYSPKGDFSHTFAVVRKEPNGVASTILDGRIYEATADEKIDRKLVSRAARSK
jgi:predicted phosphodiesterase